MFSRLTNMNYRRISTLKSRGDDYFQNLQRLVGLLMTTCEAIDQIIHEFLNGNCFEASQWTLRSLCGEDHLTGRSWRQCFDREKKEIKNDNLDFVKSSKKVSRIVLTNKNFFQDIKKCCVIKNHKPNTSLTSVSVVLCGIELIEYDESERIDCNSMLMKITVRGMR